MVSNILITTSLVTLMTFGDLDAILSKETTLASHEISLADRWPENKEVNNIFEDNILLNLAYMDGKVSIGKNINWDEIKKPFHYQFSLNPNQVFAFHEDVLPEYEGKVVKTTNAHFNSQEGFKSDGYLFGDGVCHLASLINWVAKDAGLDAKAPNNHDFMPIPEISKEYGVSIYNYPGYKDTNAKQNLYITNNKNRLITFKFDYDGDKVKVSVSD